MKVLDLQCGYGHDFEGWFASEDDFQSQWSRHLLSCPLCGDTGISKRPSAPRLNLGNHAAAASGADPDALPAASEAQKAPPPSSRAQRQGDWLRAVRRLMAETEDVGLQFAQEVRRIHEGKAPDRAIHGQATRTEAEALLEEGFPVLPLPLPLGFKNTLQ